MEGLCRIEVEGKPFFLLTSPVNGGLDSFEITLCDGENVWRRKVCKEEVQSLAKAVDMDIQEYANQTLSALTGQITDATNFVYHVERQDENVMFSWKKCLQDGVKFQLGSVILNSVPDSPRLIMEMFGLAVKQINQLKGDLKHLYSENTRLSKERDEAMKLLDKCITAKDNVENDLYFKFASVLNKKKEKIRQLKSQDEEKDLVDAGSDEKESHSQMNPVSESESARTRDDQPQDKPSTHTASLLPEDEENTTQVNAKRRRRRGPQKGTPKSKLVLPKVPSLKKTPSTSSEDSINSPRRLLRKRTSQKAEPDPDDLMAEMEM